MKKAAVSWLQVEQNSYSFCEKIDLVGNCIYLLKIGVVFLGEIEYNYYGFKENNSICRVLNPIYSF